MTLIPGHSGGAREIWPFEKIGTSVRENFRGSFSRLSMTTATTTATTASPRTSAPSTSSDARVKATATTPFRRQVIFSSATVQLLISILIKILNILFKY
jgi:hypothetical protein